MKGSGVIDKTALIYGQMTEVPGARAENRSYGAYGCGIFQG